MYKFETEAIKNAYRTALETEAVQHVSIRMFDASGTEITVGENDIDGTPSIDSRCIADEAVFNIGELYVSELKIRIKNETVRTQSLIGGEIRLTLSVETDNYGRISVPLGVFDITDAARDTPQAIEIVGNDHLGRLAVPVEDATVGRISLENVMKTVADKAKVVFAQKASEIEELFVLNGTKYESFMLGNCTRFETTCAEEVQQIALAIGGFPVANREGKIEFRRFNTIPVMNIPANRRKSIKLKECNFGIKGVSYADLNTAMTASEYDTSSIICVPKCKYIWSNTTDLEKRRSEAYEICRAYLEKLYTVNIVPGETEFYGDPTLDLGDTVTLTDGINDSKPSSFLVTGSYWQFRAPQLITSGGAPSIGQYVSVSASQGSSAVPSSSGGTGTSKTIGTSELTAYTGELFPDAERTAARTKIGCRDSTTAFINCTLVLCGMSTDTVTANVCIGDIQQPVSPKTAVSKGRYTTITIACEAAVKSGTHAVSVTACGNAILTAVSGCVYGQDVTAEELDYSSDYAYSVADEAATITEYKGESVNVELPEKLGGVAVKTIGDTAFTGTAIETAYIPEGTEEIL